MYKKHPIPKTTINRISQVEGETIEQKVYRMVHNGEPIREHSPLIYTERKDGVKPEHNIRTDRFEVAIDAMDYVDRSNKAKRAAGIKERAEALEALKANKNDGGAGQ